LLLLSALAASLGAARIPLKDAYRLILDKIPLLSNFVTTEGIQANHQVIMYQIRLPRILLAMFVGIGLSASGVMYQGLFRNPMADPYIIGISSGATLGASIAMCLGVTSKIPGVSGIVIGAFAGALAVSFVVFNISRTKGGYLSVLTLLLSGIAIGSLCSAATSFIMLTGGEDSHRIIFWIMGSISSAVWQQVMVVVPVVTAGCIAFFFFTRSLNILAFGEQRAKQLGIPVNRVKTIVVVIASVVVAAVVSVSGIIGFIGLIVPHMVRLVTGPDNRVLLPVSVFAGGVTLLLADTLARTVLVPRELPVGIITALLGTPFFIYLLRKSRVKGGL
ncbi:MAG: iron ABC transporter permease, partial [Spirochaetales bacterium]